MVMRAGAFWLILFLLRSAAAQQLPVFDFKNPKTADEWKPNRNVSDLKATGEGLLLKIDGLDPFITGPARDYPPGVLLWLRMRIKSEQGGAAQVFYYKDGPREEHSVKAAVTAGEWEDLRLPLPALGKGYHLRIDPPGDGGKTIIARVAFEPRDILKAPNWLAPVPPNIKADSLSLKVGQLELIHSSRELGGFVVKVAGEPMAIGGNRGLIGYLHQGKLKWIDLHRAAQTEARIGNEWIEARATFTDDDGAEWRIAQAFLPSNGNLAIEVRTVVTTSQDRLIVHLPLLFLFLGAGSFGEKKTQAIFPGLEYLDKDEPSSSEADIEGPGSKRQVPDSAKITIPLMSIAANGRYLGLIWQASDGICAVFDSPDRLYISGGHVMGLLFPGSDPTQRSEGNLMPSDGTMLRAKAPLALRATIVGGNAQSAIPAVWDYHFLNGLPKVPTAGLLADYVRLGAAGWLDSKIGEQGLFRHAYPGQFNAHPAADAVVMMDWLAARCEDKALAAKLAERSKSARARVAYGDWSSAVGHIRTQAPALLLGDANEAATRAARQGWELLKRFSGDGSVKYEPAGLLDYGRTHFAKDANGLTANIVAAVLGAGVFSGDRKLIDEGLLRLRALDKYKNTVPRGAQTWEIPLHTPDILACAHLVRGYTLGYQITGEKHFLEQASYWAWTGVPFVYLHNPSGKPIGLYSTIAVFGATQWKAPNWMGQPVQWCGLVYADALYRLAPLDPNSPWQQLADGITASGIQQTWPVGSDPDRQGLLPDSFMPRRQIRVDVCINPATLQAPAARFYRQPPIYSFHTFKDLFVHVPGEVIKSEEERGSLWLRVRPCTNGAYSVLICGFKQPPRVTINAAPPAADAVKFTKDDGRLILRLTGESSILLDDLK
jgi:hypothetical protein